MKLLLLLLISVCAYGQDQSISSYTQYDIENYTVQIGKKSIENLLKQLDNLTKTTNLNNQTSQLFLSFAEQNKILPMTFSGFNIPKNTKKSFVLITNPDEEFRYKLPSDAFSKPILNTDDFILEQNKLMFFMIQKIQDDSLVSVEYIDHNNKSTRLFLNKPESDKLIQLIGLSQESTSEALQFLFAEYAKYLLQKM